MKIFNGSAYTFRSFMVAWFSGDIYKAFTSRQRAAYHAVAIVVFLLISALLMTSGLALETNTFNDSTQIKNISFYGAPTSETVYIELPATTRVLNATIEVIGFDYLWLAGTSADINTRMLDLNTTNHFTWNASGASQSHINYYDYSYNIIATRAFSDIYEIEHDGNNNYLWVLYNDPAGPNTLYALNSDDLTTALTCPENQIGTVAGMNWNGTNLLILSNNDEGASNQVFVYDNACNNVVNYTLTTGVNCWYLDYVAPDYYCLNSGVSGDAVFRNLTINYAAETATISAYRIWDPLPAVSSVNWGFAFHPSNSSRLFMSHADRINEYYIQTPAPRFDTGQNGNFDDEFGQVGATTHKLELNRTAFNEYLASCTPDANGNCDVPINVSSQTVGILTMSNLNVTHGWYNVTVYNETTGNVFDMSIPDQATLTVHCTDETISIDMTSAYTTFLLNCTLQFVRLDLLFGTNQHFRTLVNPSSNGRYDFYILDLNANSKYDIEFLLYDLTGEYSGSTLSLYKNINNQSITITENNFDAEEKVFTHLLQNEHYSIQIDNGVLARNLGTILATGDGQKILRPTLIQAIPSMTTIHGRIQVGAEGNKDGAFIRAVYNDTSGLTTNVTLIIYNATNVNLPIVYYSESASNNVAFTYSPANINNSYIAHWIITHTTFGNLAHRLPVLFESEDSRPSGIPQVYLMMGGLGVCVLLALVFGPRHADFGAVVISLVAGFFWWRGWFTGYIEGAVILLVFILSLINLLSKKGRGG